MNLTSNCVVENMHVLIILVSHNYMSRLRSNLSLYKSHNEELYAFFLPKLLSSMLVQVLNRPRVNIYLMFCNFKEKKSS